MKAIKFILVVFLFISITVARETVQPFTSQETDCSPPACDSLDLDVGASEVKQSAVGSGNKEEQKKYDVQKHKGLKRRKVRRKFRKGSQGKSGQGLKAQDYGHEGGQKSQNQHADAYRKKNEEGEAKKKYAEFDEAKGHMSKNQKQSYFKSWFRDSTNNNNKFYDVYDEGGYHNKGGQEYSSYNDIDYDQNQKKRKHDLEKGAGQNSESDYDRLRSVSSKIDYGGKKGGDDFYDHESRHGDETNKSIDKKHESSDGVL